MLIKNKCNSWILIFLLGFRILLFLLQTLLLGFERFKYEKNENKWKIMEKSFFQFSSKTYLSLSANDLMYILFRIII